MVTRQAWRGPCRALLWMGLLLAAMMSFGEAAGSGSGSGPSGGGDACGFSDSEGYGYDLTDFMNGGVGYTWTVDSDRYVLAVCEPIATSYCTGPSNGNAQVCFEWSPFNPSNYRYLASYDEASYAAYGSDGDGNGVTVTLQGGEATTACPTDFASVINFICDVNVSSTPVFEMDGVDDCIYTFSTRHRWACPVVYPSSTTHAPDALGLNSGVIFAIVTAVVCCMSVVIMAIVAFVKFKLRGRPEFQDSHLDKDNIFPISPRPSRAHYDAL